MITPKLEELIWDGRAEYKTWTIGVGAAGLNVKNNQTVIILALDYFGYLDSGEEGPGVLPPLWREKMNKQITFYSKSKRHSVLARNYYDGEQGVQSSHHRYEMYFVFTDNIICNIASFEPVENWTFISGQAPIRSGQKPPPLGYGNLNGGFGTPQVVLNAQFNTSQSDDEYIPFPDTRPTKAINYNNFETAFSSDSQQLIPGQFAGGFGEMQYPLMTVHYVEINERLKAKFA